MPDSRENDQDPLRVLPRPELNPLVNPLLENHLGRWAEVYFTAAPEQREQAVEELLRELQSARLEPARQDCQLEAAPQMGAACPDCQWQNPAGQRFCGNCGAHLEKNAGQFPPQPAEIVISDRSPDSPGTDSSGPGPGPPHFANDPNAADLQWLREKAFSQWDEVESPASSGKRLLFASLTLFVLAGAWASLHWLRSEPVSSPIPPANMTPQKSEDTQAPQSIPEQPRIPAVDRSKRVTVAPLSLSPHPASENGSQELLLAQQDLDSGSGSRDSSQAAKLLWKAVGKQNVQAALLLSDLYARGDGVARNCDQARLLLVAAAKKGSPAAAQQLRTLQSSGCP